MLSFVRPAWRTYNGQLRTLGEVIALYNEGGGVGQGVAVANQTLPPDKLHPTPRDVTDLQTFLVTLTDTTHRR